MLLITQGGAATSQLVFESWWRDVSLSWESLQTPNNSCHSFQSCAEQAYVCTCILLHASQVVYECVTACWCKCIGAEGVNPTKTHTRCSSSECILQRERAKPYQLLQQHIKRVGAGPARPCWAPSLGGRPECAHSRLLCASLTFCLSYMNVFSLRLPFLHPFASSRPFFSFLAAVEVTFINGEFMCMTAPKPELWFRHPRRLSVNSCNHQSAKSLPFRAHRLWMRWLLVIHGVKNISTTADLHWYWYAVISSWFCLSGCLEDLPRNAEMPFINNPERNEPKQVYADNECCGEKRESHQQQHKNQLRYIFSFQY